MEKKALMMKRGVIRTKVTTIENSSNVLLSNGSLEELITNKEKLMKCQSDLEKLNDEVQAFSIEMKEEELMSEFEKVEYYNDIIIGLLCSLNLKIDKMSERKSEDGESCRTTSSRGRVPRVKLPQLNIKKFSGNPLKWQEFWDSFESMIHSDLLFDEIVKFNYLLSYIESEAKSVIEGISVTKQNYQIAIDLLKERFGRKEVIIFAHLDKLFSLPVANNETKNLRTTVDDCEKHIRSLEAFGTLTTDQIFTPLILSKLPQTLRINLHRKNGSKPWDLNFLRQILKEEIRARELGERNFGEKITEKQHDNVQPRKNFHRTSAEVLHSNSAPRKIVCIFCEDEHYSDECNKYKSVENRMEKLSNENRCFKCLFKNHTSSKCRKPRLCVHCQKTTHHRSLCFRKFGAPPRKNDKNELSTVAEVLKVVSTTEKQLHTKLDTFENHSIEGLIQTAMTWITNSNGERVRVRLILDPGSNRTFITNRLARLLNLKHLFYDELSIWTFAAKTSRQLKCPIVEFCVHGIDGEKRNTIARVVPSISGSAQRKKLDVKMYPTLKNLYLADPYDKENDHIEAELLIGNEFYYEFVKNHRIELSNGLVVLDTIFGWVPAGRISEEKQKKNQTNVMLTVTSQECFADVGFNLEKFWSLESIGILDDPSISDEDVAIQIFNETVQFDGKRYNVTWPWKNKEPELPENYELAFGRLKSLMLRMKDSPEILKMYNEILQDQLLKGIIEKVTNDSIVSIRKHYIPHHYVLKPEKSTTKLRIVYDASAKKRKSSNSLNDCLLRGPVIMEDLVGILLRLRLNHIAIVCDIEKAFLQVGIQAHDRDVTRFLWLKEINKPCQSDNVEIYRFCRTPFGIISSPFLLAATIRYHLNKRTSILSAQLERNLYVDNVITGCSTVNEASVLYRKSKELFSSASMNLREWSSNSEKFLQTVSDSDRAHDDVISVLGLKWNTKTDMMKLGGLKNMLQIFTNATKRDIASRIAQVFDPLGYYAPIIINAKIIMQQLWKLKLKWEDDIPNQQKEQWREIETSFNGMSTMEFPRYVGVNNFDKSSEYELHCFVDASKKAYAAVVYLRIQQSQEILTNIMFSKSKVAPIKEMSVPRLELMALVIGARVLNFVERNLDVKIGRSVIWSDSKCNLFWIQSTKMKPVFVENRVREIKLITKHVKFRYIPTDLNPADIPTRGMTCLELRSSKLWWHGPEFLFEQEELWPENCIIETVDDVEFENECDNSEVLTVNCSNFVGSPFGIDIKRFSSLYRLLRVTAYLFRLVDRCKIKNAKFDSTLNSSEMERARKKWEKHIINCSFQEQVSCIQTGRQNKLVKQLGLFIEDDIIRCKGRIGDSDLQYNEKFPILLPKGSYFTSLIIESVHRKLLHAGARHTLSELRSNYWIPNGRSTVQKILKRCVRCRKHEGPSYTMPPFPSLPKERICEGYPFACTGLDYLGPLYIVDSSVNRKIWICLFTCAVVRAVHLEIVQDLSTEEFLLALRRFISRRGKPDQIISDNASTFKLASKTVRSAFEDIVRSPAVQDYSSIRAIEWKFITQHSPWMGGLYERMVGSVKRSLRKTINGASLTLIQLQTITTEVEAIVNSRPLIYVEASIEDHKILTPAHFLYGSPKIGLPEIIVGDDKEFKLKSTTKDALIENWKRGQNILKNYWSCWRKDYLASLRERSEKLSKSSLSTPSIGAVVLIEENVPRGQWKIGKIKELLQSRDGLVRSVVIALPNGKSVQRPVVKLHPLEYDDLRHKSSAGGTSHRDNHRPEEQNPVSNIATNSISGRSTRGASILAGIAIKKISRRECHDNA